MDATSKLLAAAQALDPVRPPSHEHYVTPPDGGIHTWISRWIAKDPSAHLLTLGGIGSGKTTELLRAKEVIEKQGLARVWHAPLDAYFDLANLGEGRLVTLAGLAMLAVLRELGDIPSGAVREASVSLHASVRTARATTAALTMPEFARQHGVPSPPNAAADVATSIEVLVRRLREVRAERGSSAEPRRIVLLVDALDRRSFEDFATATSADLATLRAFDVGVAIVGNVEWRHGLTAERRYAYHDVRTNSAFDPMQERDASFLRTVLSTRAPDVFSREAADAIVVASGGVLRDLLHLARSAVYEARERGEERVSLGAFTVAHEAFREGRRAMLSQQEREALTRLEGGAPLDTAMGDRLTAKGCAILREGAYEPHPVMRALALRPEAA
jgi:hypothetical protein